MLPILLSTFLSAASSAWGQQQVQMAPNQADLVGTWVSASQGVITGPSFANPLNFSFNYPKVPGVSYSFTSDGHFEEAWYQFFPNASTPNCITGVLQWQHGNYQALQNGSIIMNPIASDGRQQVQDTCAAVSNIIQQFNSTVFMSTWENRTDPILGQYLILYQFNGVPVQPLYPYASPPVMLPTQTLTANVTAGQQANGALYARAQSILSMGAVTVLGGLIGASAVLFW